MAKKDKNYALYIVALVAIIAVVGVVVMLFGGNKSVTIGADVVSEERDMAGQATCHTVCYADYNNAIKSAGTNSALKSKYYQKYKECIASCNTVKTSSSSSLTEKDVEKMIEQKINVLGKDKIVCEHVPLLNKNEFENKNGQEYCINKGYDTCVSQSQIYNILIFGKLFY
ncbi:MAG: hypothetical protein ABIG89_02190 [Candidatus Woesearchaeota archaeon]